MYFRLILLAILMGITLLICGCNGSRESEEVGYVIAIGLDKADEQGWVKVTYQIASPAIEGGKGGEGKESIVITNTAVTLGESLNLLNSMIALVPSLAHLKVLVIGEDLARQGLTDIWGSLMRYREYRGSMFVLIARGTAQHILEESKPVFDISPSKYFEMMLGSGEHTGYYLRTSFHQFYLRIKSSSGQPYATLVGLNLQTGQGKIEDTKVPGGKASGYLAENIARKGGAPLDFAGTAVFSSDKMVGMLSTEETRTLAMLLGKYPRGFLSVEDPLMPQNYVNVNVRLGAKPKIEAVLADGRPVITVKILLEAEFTNYPSGINYELDKNLNLVEAQVSKVIQQEMVNLIHRTQELDADVAGLGFYLRPSFATRQEYFDYKWNQKYREAEVNVEVETKIRRTGLMLRTHPVE